MFAAIVVFFSILSVVSILLAHAPAETKAGYVGRMGLCVSLVMGGVLGAIGETRDLVGGIDPMVLWASLPVFGVVLALCMHSEHKSLKRYYAK